MKIYASFPRIPVYGFIGERTPFGKVARCR
ncbi:hypothetical protein ABID12_000223 [Martelella mangrovi]|uniref:Uncharacterized protein n=1 Tax=Martelella mangrovi TaxID=1397477 RepID=A0ABV2I5W2_9HYPH